MAGYEELLNLETERKKAGNQNDICERVSEVYEGKVVSNLEREEELFIVSVCC